MKLYLASASPRRYEIMKMMPFAFAVHVPSFDERAYEQELLADAAHRPAPAELTCQIAKGKALCAYRELKAQFPDESVLVLSADTIVVLDGEVFGKGETRERSLDMLNRLNGKMHEVISAVWLVGDASPSVRSGDVGGSGSEEPARSIASAERSGALAPEVMESVLEVSRVYFGMSDPALLERYVDLYRPFDKAGAYGIQDGGALLIERIDGNYHNIMGMPLRRVYLLLRRYLEVSREDTD